MVRLFGKIQYCFTVTSCACVCVCVCGEILHATDATNSIDFDHVFYANFQFPLIFIERISRSRPVSTRGQPKRIMGFRNINFAVFFGHFLRGFQIWFFTKIKWSSRSANEISLTGTVNHLQIVYNSFIIV